MLLLCRWTGLGRTGADWWAALVFWVVFFFFVFLFLGGRILVQNDDTEARVGGVLAGWADLDSSKGRYG